MWTLDLIVHFFFNFFLDQHVFHFVFVFVQHTVIDQDQKTKTDDQLEMLL